jgi:predicted DNA-binding transcriptional regulator AlpA
MNSEKKPIKIIFELDLSEEDKSNLIERSIEKTVQKFLDGYHPQEPTIKRDLCTLTDAVEITGLQKSPLYKLTMPKNRANDPDPMPFYKSGKFLRFRRIELEAWVERRLIRPDEGSRAALILAKSAGRKRHSA